MFNLLIMVNLSLLILLHHHFKVFNARKGGFFDLFERLFYEFECQKAAFLITKHNHVNIIHLKSGIFDLLFELKHTMFTFDL